MKVRQVKLLEIHKSATSAGKPSFCSVVWDHQSFHSVTSSSSDASIAVHNTLISSCPLAKSPNATCFASSSVPFTTPPPPSASAPLIAPPTLIPLSDQVEDHTRNRRSELMKMRERRNRPGQRRGFCGVIFFRLTPVTSCLYLACGHISTSQRTLTRLGIDYNWNQSDSECENDEVLKQKNVLLVTGPVGSRKSSAIYACAKEQGIKVLELSASQCRNGAQVNKRFGETFKSRKFQSLGKLLHFALLLWKKSIKITLFKLIHYVGGT